MTSLYALLVGIDQYDKRSHVPPLRGCTNDIRAVKTYLEGRVTDDRQLHIRMLLDEQATRQAIIDGFKAHLQQAQAGDTVLFYYAGHGSQNKAPEAFWAVDPDRLNETLVCYDSRTEDVWDLADKELAQLIAEVSQRNPHITIVLDCCHSGSGTRKVKQLDSEPTFLKRRAPLDERDRPLESFIVSPQTVEQMSQTVKQPGNVRTRSFDAIASKSGWQMPQGRHVLISACRDTEEASEYNANGHPCGAFSHFLLDSLKKAKGSLTYRDLFKATQARICAQISDQAPQLEAPYLEDLDRPFLGGAIAEFPAYFTLTHCAEQGWTIDGGAVHGIQIPAETRPDCLALFSFDATAEEMHQLDQAIAQASITEVRSHLSHVQMTAQTTAALDCSTTYKAVPTDTLTNPLNIVLTGQLENVERIRQALSTAQPRSERAIASQYIKEVAEAASAKFRIMAEADRYVIVRLNNEGKNNGLVTEIPAQKVDEVLQTLTHIARWNTLADLSHSTTSGIPSNAVEIQLYQDDRPAETNHLRLSYQQREGQWQAPHFRAKLVNRTSRRLYCSLLNLSDDYSVSTPFFSSGGVWLEGHSEIWATVMVGWQLTDRIPTNVPQALWEQGITECQDILKLIVSTTEFDPTLFAQAALKNRTTAGRAIGVVNSIETVDDWMTRQAIITTVRPQSNVRISDQSAVGLYASSIGDSAPVVIQPHPQLRATVKLTAIAEAADRQKTTRSANIPTLPPTLAEQTQPLTLTSRRGTTPNVGALELSEIEQAESVTTENPLTLLVDAPLSAGESVLPVAYDGEFFLPLGYGHPQGGKTEIVLQCLPQRAGESAVNTRSLGGALQIFFRKVATQTIGDRLSQKLGLSFEYPLLAAVDSTFVQTEQAAYQTDTEAVKALVDRAETIVIYIHGIIGDTQSMVPSIQTARVDVDGQSRSLAEVYDLVLAYDYESINTSIATSAVQLKRRLAAVGIVPGHSKTVHIIAHSMGGLVSRWLLEKEQGDEIVDHLIMLGTPNAGSPWPTVQAGLTRALCFAINGLSTAAWPLCLVGSVLNAIESIDVALDEMEPDSALLSLLAASEPSIPYSIVAGNTALIPVDEKATLRARLERRLNQIAEFPFLRKENDIAVLVSSIRHVPAGRHHTPRVREVACDHMSYFIDPAGLAGLSWAVTRAFDRGDRPQTQSAIAPSLSQTSQ